MGTIIINGTSIKCSDGKISIVSRKGKIIVDGDSIFMEM